MGQEERWDRGRAGTACGSRRVTVAHCGPEGEAGVGKKGGSVWGRGGVGPAGPGWSLQPGHEASWTEGCPVGRRAQERAAGCGPEWHCVPGAWSEGPQQEGPSPLDVPVSPTLEGK